MRQLARAYLLDGLLGFRLSIWPSVGGWVAWARAEDSGEIVQISARPQKLSQAKRKACQYVLGPSCMKRCRGLAKCWREVAFSQLAHGLDMRYAR